MFSHTATECSLLWFCFLVIPFPYFCGLTEVPREEHIIHIHIQASGYDAQTCYNLRLNQIYDIGEEQSVYEAVKIAHT